MRRNYGSRSSTKKERNVEWVTEEQAELHEQALFKMGDVEADLLLKKKPTEGQVRELFQFPQYRYEKARLKQLQNVMVQAAFAPKHDMPFDKREGIILGLRLAWALAGQIYMEAQDREREERVEQNEKVLAEALRKDYPDFEGVDNSSSKD